MSVHNHPPYRPVCNERRLPDGQLRGACLDGDTTEGVRVSEQDDPITVTLTRRDAQFAVEHLRFLADREKATQADHAAANLSARFVAAEIERAMGVTSE